MENVPWHEEVLSFVQQLCSRLFSQDYEIACEHEHSNCVLIANKRFKANGKWKTWIDYEEFHRLSARHRDNQEETFDALDYAAETPAWAVFGATERGFDPEETRFHRKKKKQ